MFGHIDLLDSSSVLGDVRFEWLYLKFLDLCLSDGCLGASFWMEESSSTTKT